MNQYYIWMLKENIRQNQNYVYFSNNDNPKEKNMIIIKNHKYNL